MPGRNLQELPDVRFHPFLFLTNFLLFSLLAVIILWAPALALDPGELTPTGQRLIAAGLAGLAGLSLFALFDNYQGQILALKVLLVAHAAFLVANSYNFITANVPVYAALTHVLFVLLLLIGFWRSPD